MISCNSLSDNGRLGNQMFQYAAIQGIAHNKDYDWMISPKNNNNPVTLSSNIYDCFYLDYQIENHIGISSNLNPLLEKFHGFDVDVFDSCPDNVDLLGYFQSYRYFENISKKIKRDFTFLPTMTHTIPQKNTLSIHVRRCDYLSLLNYHPVLGEKYYEEALDSIGPFSEAIVFSDDIEWCKTLSIFSGFVFSQGSPYFDLHLMSKCDKHIIANSSFSWWGAWLSGSDHVIAPKQWFGPALSEHSTDGYYLPSWVVI